MAQVLHFNKVFELLCVFSSALTNRFLIRIYNLYTNYIRIRESKMKKKNFSLNKMAQLLCLTAGLTVSGSAMAGAVIFNTGDVNTATIALGVNELGHLNTSTSIVQAAALVPRPRVRHPTARHQTHITPLVPVRQRNRLRHPLR